MLRDIQLTVDEASHRKSRCLLEPYCVYGEIFRIVSLGSMAKIRVEERVIDLIIERTGHTLVLSFRKHPLRPP